MLASGEKAYLERIYKEIGEKEMLDKGYSPLYLSYKEPLQTILSSYHSNLNKMFYYMNTQLRKGENRGKYFHAPNSREAIDLFGKIKNCITSIKSEKLYLDDRYALKIKELETFLSLSGGTHVPDNFENIEVIETESIFKTENSIEINRKKIHLILVGQGSYANVYKYFDEDYDKYFVLKRLKEDAPGKAKERFLREFEITKKLRHPNIVEAYKLNETNMEYTMEFLDQTLYDYINRNNDKIEKDERFHFIYQILKIFFLLEKLTIYHRDISYTNILLKDYDNGKMVKICDFGLVKLEESTLTDPNTEFKGSLNDPHLGVIGLKSYCKIHETYALTRLIVFILTGKTNYDKIKNDKIKEFLLKGTSRTEDERFQNISELKDAVIKLYKEI